MRELSATAGAMLSVLHDGPQTGHHLTNIVNDRFGSFFSVARSHCYQELSAMEQFGFIRPRRSHGVGQQYAITPTGKREFVGWLATPPNKDHLRSPLLLRLIHSAAMPRAQRQALIDRATVVYTTNLERAKADLRAINNGATTDMDPYVRAIADFNVATARAALKMVTSLPR